MPNLVWDLIWRDRGVVSGLNKTADATDRAERKAKAFRVAVGVGLVVAGAAAIKFGRDSVRAYSEAQDAQKALGFAFQKFPKLADTNQVALQRLNSEIQKKTRFDDDNIASGQAVLAQFKLTGRQITEVTPLLTDYAAKTGKDIPDAARDVGKALLGNAKALKNIGISYKSTGDAGKDFTNITALMRDKVGGFAELEGKTATGRLAILHNQFGELQEAVGKHLVPALTAGVDALTGLVEVVGENADVIVPLATGVAGLSAALWLGNKAAKAYAAVQGVLGTAMSSNSKVAVGFASVVSKAGPWGLAIGAGATLLGLFAGQQALAERQTKEFTDSLTFQKGALDANSTQMLTNKLATEGVLEAAKLAGVSETDYVRALLQGGPVRDNLLNQLYDTEAAHKADADALRGNVTEHLDLATAAGTAADTLKLTGGSLDASKRAANQAGAAYVGATAGLTDQEAAAKRLKNAQHDLNTELQKSIDKFTILREGALSQQRANMAWWESVDAVSQSVKDNGRSINAHTAKGRANRAAIIGMMTALNDKVTADVKEAGHVRKGETALDAYKRAQKVATSETRYGETQIRRIAHAHHLNEQEVRDMLKRYMKTPEAAGRMNPALKAAADKVRAVDRALENTHSRNVKITYASNAKKFAKAFDLGLTLNSGEHDSARADGGVLPGFTPGRDVHHFSSPTAGRLHLSGGEAIMRPEWTRAVGGPPAVNRMNAAARSGSFAGGGIFRLGVNSSALNSPNFDALSNRIALRLGDRLAAGVGSKLDQAYAASGAFGGVGAYGVGRLAQNALARVGQAWDIGTCLRFVRMMAGAPGGTYDATAAWSNAHFKHRGDRNAPSGVPMYWGGGHGHIAVSVGGGRIVGTDFPRTGRIGLSSAARLTSAWGKPYLGWANDVNGVVTSRYGLPHRFVSRAASTGGVISTAGAVNVAENGPERILSAAQTRTFDRMVRVMDSRGAGNTYVVNISAPNYVGSRQELRKTLVDMTRSGAFEVVKR